MGSLFFWYDLVADGNFYDINASLPDSGDITHFLLIVRIKSNPNLGPGLLVFERKYVPGRNNWLLIQHKASAIITTIRNITSPKQQWLNVGEYAHRARLFRANTMERHTHNNVFDKISDPVRNSARLISNNRKLFARYRIARQKIKGLPIKPEKIRYSRLPRFTWSKMNSYGGTIRRYLCF